MKFLSVFALAAIAHFQLAAAGGNTSTPYCTSQYYGNDVCQKFQLPEGVDCSDKGGDPYNISPNPNNFSSTRALEIAIGITNVFENSQPQNDYATCTSIGDMRGYTCGSGGYTSDDGSMQDPLQRYGEMLKKLGRKNPFGKYMRKINNIADHSGCSPFRGSLKGLSGLGPIWTKTACTDPVFRAAQDASAASQIDHFSSRHAAFAGVTSNLGLAIFRDTMEMHGDGGGEPHLGLDRLMELTKKEFNGTFPSEKDFIPKFLEIRRQLLCCYRPVDSKGVHDLTWPSAADRISDLQNLVNEGNWDLNPPVKLVAYQITIDTNFDLHAVPKECNSIKP